MTWRKHNTLVLGSFEEQSCNTFIKRKKMSLLSGKFDQILAFQEIHVEPEDPCTSALRTSISD